MAGPETAFARVVFKSYGGRAYIIFKGYPGARKFFTGTRYGVQHAKVIKMGIGRAGMRASAKGGFILSAILLTAFDVTEYFLSDRETLGQLIGQIAGDVTKAAIGGAIGLGAGMAAGLVIGTFALGPLVVALIVGVVASWALDKLDSHYHLTEKVQAALDRGIARVEAKRAQVHQGMIEAGWEAVGALTARLVDLAEDEAAAFVRRQINGLTWRIVPRL